MLTKSHWTISQDYQNSPAASAFSSLDKVFALSGQPITKDTLSNVRRVEVDNTGYYVKRYTRAGKGLRRYIGRSRIKAEWENMLFFHEIGVPAAPVVAYGEEKKHGVMTRGALITREVENTWNLKMLVDQDLPQLYSRQWMGIVISQVAAATRKLHENNFIHTDLKWRNILVTKTENPVIALIDCPAGAQMSGWLQKRNIVKDLACLDKVAKEVLSQSQRLSFYKQYAGVNRLNKSDKKLITKILGFFEGRE
ncbi:lipopolysaccharide kinase InaA family protein [Endozoicomonas sp. 2B-B]